MKVYGGNRASARRFREHSGRVLPGRYSIHGETAPVRSGDMEKSAPRRRAEMGPRDAVIGAARRRPSAPAPIWFAALEAASYLATGTGERHQVDWDCANGRALYTNAGADRETIHPLGVSLEGGQTLAVYWTPGETGYTMEVTQAHRFCA